MCLLGGEGEGAVLFPEPGLLAGTYSRANCWAAKSGPESPHPSCTCTQGV